MTESSSLSTATQQANTLTTPGPPGRNGHTRPTNKDIAVGLAVDIISLCAVCGISYYMSKYLSKYMQQQQLSRPTNQEAKERLTKLLMDRAEAELTETDDEEEGDEEGDQRKLRAMKEKVRRQVIKSLDMNEYETAIAEDVIDPNDLTTSFRDVGGIDEIKAELWDLVVLPILRPDLFRSDSGLVSPPRGILLYGAPGTGKTMLAKAIAKESGATFVNVRLSNIMDKWFGESNKLVAGTFSLAKKLAPSVIFIDEIDTFLNQRDSSEGSATTSMKSEFLTLWDGMLSDGPEGSPPVMVLGATNRPYDVDSAILRRLPRTFEIGLPNATSRLQILNLFLEKHNLTDEARKMIPRIAQRTQGYSGSDLKELCRAAAMVPIREITREASRQAVMGGASSTNGNGNGNKKQLKRKKSDYGPPPGAKIRPVGVKDFEEAMAKVKRTGEAANKFKNSAQDIRAADSGGGETASQIGIDLNQLLRMMMNGNINVNGASNSTTQNNADIDEVPSL